MFVSVCIYSYTCRYRSIYLILYVCSVFIEMKCTLVPNFGPHSKQMNPTNQTENYACTYKEREREKEKEREREREKEREREIDRQTDRQTHKNRHNGKKIANTHTPVPAGSSAGLEANPNCCYNCGALSRSPAPAAQARKTCQQRLILMKGDSPQKAVHAATRRTCSTTLQQTVTHCNTLQHTAAHCNTLQHTATHCNTL